MSANGISHLEYKADRQVAKLEAASTKRAATGRRSTYDLTQLPTVYAPNDNDTSHVIKQSHPAGLITGRPWVSGSPTGPFTLDWYGTISYPTPIGTYSTNHGGVTLNTNSYIDVGLALSSGTFTVTVDADLGLGWDGDRWHVIWANEVYFGNPSGVFAYINDSTTIDFGVPNAEAEGTISNITTSGRVLYTFVSDGSTQTVYANGAFVATNSSEASIPSNNTFYIGSRHDNSGGSGPIDCRGGTYYSVKVEITALTSQQVADAYTAWAATL